VTGRRGFLGRAAGGFLAAAGLGKVAAIAQTLDGYAVVMECQSGTMYAVPEGLRSSAWVDYFRAQSELLK
jgi:hypothetical protein